MRYTSELSNVAESPMVQIATAAEAMPGSLKLCYGESDLPTPAFICEAADAALKAGHTFYTHTAGALELREAIAQQIHHLHGVGYRPTEIMSTVGASMAIYAAIRAFVSRGDNAVIVSPTYAIFSNGVIMAGGEPRPVPLVRDDGGFRLDLDRVRAAIDRHTRMVIINSPSNPTGWVISAAEQRALLELAAQHDLIILADEVYERLVYEEPIAPSFARVAGNRDRLIVVNSFSKTYNMTGWRLGWAQASEATIKTMYRAVEFMTSNPSAMVQQAGIVALRDGEPYIAELRQHYTERRAQVVTALAATPGVSLPAPAGAFYAFPQIAGLTDSTAFATRLLRDTGLAIAPGVGFGESGEGYVRICFAASEATVTDALARLCAWVNQTGDQESKRV
ncbi:MAG: aminotransferase class I/II-fold pyridoxal phosphate-dependent enzyme [Acidobacteriota bacterium]|nr:aminotransferase class I/II-fold pyridoxal phosphate-dependent enzyme [Acidobacteriota bacterium]